ncbi:MAG: hypothetical protein J5760_02440, partial [Clostridia bacterium]|nr:hypothetical protein [Clostridia bacterium]
MSLHNVSELSEQILFDFAVSYKRACKQIGKDVLSASPEEQKKAKANVMPCVRNYKTGLFEELSEEESWRLLKECAEKRDSLCAERRKEWESALDLFDPACAAEIRAYVGESYFGDVLCDIAMGKDGGVSVILDDNCAFSRKLVLDNAKTEGKIPKAFYESELVSLKAESGGGFTLTARAMEFYDDTEDDAEDEEIRFEERELTVSFSSAHIEKKCFNAVRSFVFNPFDWYGKNVYMLVTMVSACSYIVRKYENCRELVNEKELTLIPLCRDIAKLDWVLADDEAAPAGFPHLSALAREYGAEDLIPLVKEFANAGEGTQRKIAKLASKLFTAEKEPFMRAIYEKISNSQ